MSINSFHIWSFGLNDLAHFSKVRWLQSRTCRCESYVVIILLCYHISFIRLKKAFSWGHIQVQTPTHTHTHSHSPLSAGRSLGNTVLLQSRHTLKPSKLPPLEVGRHGGDKAKLPPLCFLFLASAHLQFPL